MAERYASGGYVEPGRPCIVGEAARDCRNAMVQTPRLRGRAAVAQRLRRLHRTDGLCERCAGIGRWTGKGLGRVTVATVVNHIIPLAHNGSDDDENTENLCRSCDLIVTAEQFGHRKPRQTIGADGWPAD